jgi:5-methylcytosine-specific restriction endonuclease McrA
MTDEERREKKRKRDAEYRAAHKQNEAERHAEYYAANKEKVAARKAEYYAANKEKIAVRKAEYRAAHKEKVAAYQAEYRAANKEKEAAYNAEYQKTHPEIIRFHSQRRRCRKLNAAGNDYITTELLEARWDFYGRRCYLCGKPATATDHVKPLAKGGAQWPCNLRPICPVCNSMKNAHWPYDFEAHKARIAKPVTD